MVKELVIHSSPQEVSIALLEDKVLMELNKESNTDSYTVGDIYLGRVKKIMPSLNAAFVDVGYERDAFLHYLDLGPQICSLIKLTKQIKSGNQSVRNLKGFKLERDIEKTGKISDLLSKGLLIPVQIAKEPISTKGPRLSANISFPGRYVVLVPFSNTVSISRKIKSGAERSRLRKIVEQIKPDNFGIIVRTVSENKGVEEMQKDIMDLIARWDAFSQNLPVAEPTKCVLGEIKRTSSILRDILNPDFANIHVDDEVLYEEIKSYIKNISPEMEHIVKLYKSKEPIFEYYSIEKQIKSSFGRTINLAGGAYLVVDHTEALHVIDVNSGNRAVVQDNQEGNALTVNKEAAKEIARQLRLRDMGGIVVIDFIDMHRAESRKELFDFLRQAMLSDRTKHTILPPSKFGLVQLTRQRVRPEMKIITTESCPACHGTGEVKASILLENDIKSDLDYLLEQQQSEKITLCVHPYIAAYLTKGLFSIQFKWFIKYRRWISIQSFASYYLTEFHFLGATGEEIKM